MFETSEVQISKYGSMTMKVGSEKSYTINAIYGRKAYLCKIDQAIRQTVCTMIDCRPAMGDRKSESMLSYRDKEDPSRWWLIISICGYVQNMIVPFVHQTGHVYPIDATPKRCAVCTTRTSKSCSCGRRLCCSLCQEIDIKYHSVNVCSGLHHKDPEPVD